MLINDVLVVVPSFNEAKILKQTIGALLEYVPSENILIVDDGSYDDTDKITFPTRVRIIRFPLNCGVGAVLKHGIATAERLGFEVLVVFDADGQHKPEYIAKLLHLLEEEKADLVIGCRNFGKYDMGRANLLAIKILRLTLKLRYGIDVPDPSSGFRAMKVSSFSKNMRFMNDDYLEDTVGLIEVGAKLGFRINCAEVTMEQRQHGKSSHSFFMKSMRYLSTYLRIIIGRNLKS
jgi:glycosyltransferase involved in cell wall biosynthesis